MAMLPAVVRRHTFKDLRPKIRKKIIASWFDYLLPGVCVKA
jgi:hypothetical protein